MGDDVDLEPTCPHPSCGEHNYVTINLGDLHPLRRSAGVRVRAAALRQGREPRHLDGHKEKRPDVPMKPDLTAVVKTPTRSRQQVNVTSANTVSRCHNKAQR